jgi:hypothetical protein
MPSDRTVRVAKLLHFWKSLSHSLFNRGILRKDPLCGNDLSGITSPIASHISTSPVLVVPSLHGMLFVQESLHLQSRRPLPQIVGAVMTELEQGELRINVPVGFLLTEEQEVAVSVNRPDGRPLPIRLRLIPARQDAPDQPFVCEPTPTLNEWVIRPLAKTSSTEDGYPSPDFGGSD